MSPAAATASEAEPLVGPRGAVAAAALLLPLAGLAVLLSASDLDVRWEHHPSHFWLVLAAGGLNAALAYATGAAARRRGDARVFLVSLAFLAAAGFLGLHALATPGVLLEESNTGFVIATPVGLVVAAGFAAASGLDRAPDRARALMRHATLGQNALLGDPDWPRFRVGVNSGEAAVSLLGTEGGRTHTVIGDAVNLAARLEANAPVGGVAIGASTLSLLGTGAQVESLGRISVKGKAEPVEPYRLVAMPDEPS